MIGRLVATVAIAVAALVASPGPVAADCQGGPVRPGSVREAQGETFLGTFLRATSDPGGNETFYWDVERVYAGDLSTGLQTWGEGRPSCHPTYYTAGVRYLVSSEPQNRDAFSVAAYRLLDGERVELHPFEGSAAAYPRELQVDTLAEALAVLVPGALPPTDTGPPMQAALAATLLVMVGALGALLGRRRFAPTEGFG
ncbi:hypothetical protein BH24CHL8_BH24CHL8_03450 [soil metagenome]